MKRIAFALATTLSTAALPAVAQQGYEWTYFRSVAADPHDTFLGIAYGVPQSDDMQMSLHCVIGEDPTVVEALLVADVVGMDAESGVVLQFTAPEFATDYDAEVVRLEEGFEGVRFIVGLDDPLWTGLMGQSALTYSVIRRGAQDLNLTGAAGPVHEFLGDCLSIADLTPDAPVMATK